MGRGWSSSSKLLKLVHINMISIMSICNGVNIRARVRAKKTTLTSILSLQGRARK
jgi:hypothetical protein